MEFDFSLPDVSNLFEFYEHEQIVVTDGGYQSKGIVFGFSIDDNNRGTIFTKRLRFGGRKRSRNWGKWLDRQVEKRKRDELLEIRGFRPKVAGVSRPKLTRDSIIRDLAILRNVESEYVEIDGRKFNRVIRERWLKEQLSKVQNWEMSA